MNRRSLVLAVASVFAAPLAALAEGGNVQIYSTINVDFEGVQTTGASAAGALPPGQLGATPTGVNSPSRSRVTSNSSNIGFRGSNDIGAGLSAIFQIESAIGVDNQATFGSNTASGSAVGGGFATRNTGVGLAGQFGRVFYGQWDTPYKVISGAVDPLYFTGIAYTGAIIGTPGFGIGPVTNGNVTLSADGKSYANAVNASFERRQGNSVQYWSPTFDGLKARVVYSANEGRSTSSSAVTQVNPAIWGFSAEYENGPAYVAWGYERHDDYFGLSAIAPAAQAVPVAALGGQPSALSRDTGNKFVGRYTAGDTQLGVIYERLKYDQTNSLAATTDFKSYARNAYAFTLVQRIGQGMLRALYGPGPGWQVRLGGWWGLQRGRVGGPANYSGLQLQTLRADRPVRVLHAHRQRRTRHLPVCQCGGNRSHCRSRQYRRRPGCAVHLRQDLLKAKQGAILRRLVSAGFTARWLSRRESLFHSARHRPSRCGRRSPPGQFEPGRTGEAEPRRRSTK